MPDYSRRSFLEKISMLAAGAGLELAAKGAFGQSAGDRPAQAESVEVLNPRHRVPVSMIIDDSTCLVNLAYYGIPQFQHVFPDRYKQPWRSLPREIPDAFVRKFGEWCYEHGVKGKYSIVPYPACVGWMDRELPGWTRHELEQSLELVRTLMMPDWDIHPEMISHTRVIDTKTGRAYPEYTDDFMENWNWTVGKSTDQIADYLAYALRILRNVGLPCEGITTPGGFGHGALPELSKATLQACRDVFQTEIPHYFRDGYTDERSVMPLVQNARGLTGHDPECVVSILCCTDDWFGGWDGLVPGDSDKFITEDLTKGRLVEVIDRGEPAIFFGHWAGIYFNGEEVGFNILKDIVSRLDERYDDLIWMKLSEIARYWAARELTSIQTDGASVRFRAPFACESFTIGLKMKTGRPWFVSASERREFKRVEKPLQLVSGAWAREGDRALVCFDLPKGESKIEIA